ncbi:MAG: Zn-dependent hydrolase [Hyphomicrobiales bacterium]|nr:Zn-dependent hydrolase [Hyphomicrobiales bacterium]
MTRAITNLGVDGGRLWADIMALAKITDPAAPFTRRSFSRLFLDGRDWLTKRFREAELETRIDAAGNLIGRIKGSDPRAGSIIVGSHTDTVPSGGRFDGIAGVAAGLEIVRMLRERKIALRHALEIVDFLAEEPSEFGLSCIGSRGMSGKLTAAQLQFSKSDGEKLSEALARVGGEPARLAEAKRSDIRAGFELHIEQGTVLEAGAIDIGVVTAIVGITRIEVVFEGTAGHAGATPMHGRRDALVAAARLVDRVRILAEESAAQGRGYFVATTGVIEARPNASNIIPGSARLIIDARSESREALVEFRERLDRESLVLARAASVERPRFATLSDTLPSACDESLRQLLKAAADGLGLSFVDIASGAGHDTAFLSHIAPAAMVFIPCKDGASHCPEEWCEPKEVAAGTTVILEAVLEFDLRET